MFKKILITLIIPFVYLINPVQGQTKKDIKDTTKTVIIFNSGTSSVPKKSYSEGNNIVKIDPLGFVFGKIPVSYERRISDLFSAQLSVGLTSKNYLREVWETGSMEPGQPGSVIYDDAHLPQNYVDQTDPLYSFDHRKADLGYMVNIQPRIYLSEEALEGSFFGLGFNLLRYNFSTPGLTNTSSESMFTGPTQKEYENIKDVIVYYGYQRLYDRLSLEYSMGLGIRKVDGVKYIAGNNNGVFYESLTNYSKKSGVTFEFSFKIGFQL